MIPESFIEDLKYHCDIESTISSYVNLKKNGRTYKGLCPFHSEKSPSFTVYPENQSFYCFGCGVGGDVVTFIKKIENIEYVEALKFLAEKNNIPFPEDSFDDSASRLKSEILAINRETARFYHSILRSDEGKAALDYLLERGLSGKTIGKFGIGYAPDTWDKLRNHLASKGFSDFAMSCAFVVKEGKNKSVYDVFRNRIIFPIIDLRGNVIAFGGRILSGDGPKYLNSGDTPLFKKSRNLFALNLAKSTKEPRMILAEGYMDVISLHQAGFDNAVATLGTALTPEQARIINTYTSEVAIAYDSDEAGQKATKRAIKLFDETGIKVKVISINGAKDPDEYIKKNGATRFKLLVEGSAGATDYAIEKIFAKYDVETPSGKVQFLDEFCKFICDGIGPIERDVYISKIANQLSVDKEAIKLQTESVYKKKLKQKKYSDERNLKIFTQEAPKKSKDPQRSKFIKYALAEDNLIAILIKNQDFFKKITKIEPTEFLTDSNRSIYEVVYNRLLSNKSVDLSCLSADLNEEQLSHLSYILAGNSGKNYSLDNAEEFIKIIKSFDTLTDPSNILKTSDEDLSNYIKGLGIKQK
ncbi:MAG: DNA primase [Oscillospiraceae bacterium]